MSNKPTAKFRSGGIEVVRWPSSNGGSTFTIQKRYKDKGSGEWKESKSLWASDLPVLAALCLQAFMAPEAPAADDSQYDDVPA